MPKERYFYPQDFQEGSQLFIEDQEFHHLIHVMRNHIDDVIELVNGQGQLASGKISKIEKKRVSLEVLTVYQAPSLDLPLILAQAIPRFNRLELIVEKGTELGMTELWLFPAMHSDKKAFSINQTERLNTILISAMKQCGRLFLPELIFMPSLKEWQKFSLPTFFGDTRPSAPTFASAWQQKNPQNGSIFCVGPESGFTSDEVDVLQQLGAEGVKLHRNILRTETAGITALSLMSHWQLGAL